MRTLLQHLKELVRKDDEDRRQAKLRADLATFTAPDEEYVLVMWTGLYARLVESHLERHQIPVRMARSDEEALAKIRIARPAVLVCYATDEPQGAGGPDLVAAVRSDPDLESISILVLVRPGEAEALDGVRAAGGADLYDDAGTMVEAIRGIMT